MSNEVKTPMLPESVTDAAIAVCHKKVGDWCDVGDVIVELETDKVMLEVTAANEGTLTQLHVKEGDIVHADSPIAIIEAGIKPEVSKPQDESTSNLQEDEIISQPQVTVVKDDKPQENITHKVADYLPMSPSQRRSAYKSPDESPRVMKESASPKVSMSIESGDYIRKPMSRLRTKIAQRLVEATQETAMLTTFNEVRMDPIIRIRKDHQESFMAKYGVKLGFMSFFTQAVCKALADFPEINASIDGNDILYHQCAHIGIAVSTERGLVVPVLKNAQDMNYAQIETSIKEMAIQAREGKIGLDQLQGGTFTITNGGVFGSMLSTPILNMPQSAILGMHAILQRPIIHEGEITIASMMYLALSYDHRLVDGQQSVQFLVRIKSLLEDPDQVLLDL
ncbi:2-oxoglutarate dehydrogenase complex dihydrolipoyllysine-residue succinyltransferase [Gammaproteobacteria bacterium]|nr:2-oxoglutarate dehydrogenase complex dihydrolipoyllysine-residue succinyltransferase [Gammaproteobacteria bacterium]